MKSISVTSISVTSIDPSRLLRRHWFTLAIAVSVISAILIGFFVGDRRMSAERVSALAEIDTYVQVLTDATAKSKARPELDGKLQGIANQMLGSSLETVDSEVRRRLNRACEELGFNDFSVTTGTSVGRPTPAKKEFKSPDSRKLREEIDFMEVQATVIARASVDKVYRLIFRVDAEPWIKRIESVRLNPSADGQQVGVTLRLTTPFMPGYVGTPPPKFDPATLQLADRYAALFSSNPFRIPPPPMVVPAAIAAVPGAAPTVTAPAQAAVTATVPPIGPGGFPYGEWQITGVIEGPSGPEAWLRHLPSGSNVVLHPTMTAGELVFRGVEYDFAVFESPSGACRIQVGTNLTQRSALLASPTNG
jgi:hypothetical protein